MVLSLFDKEGRTSVNMLVIRHSARSGKNIVRRVGSTSHHKAKQGPGEIIRDTDCLLSVDCDD